MSPHVPIRSRNGRRPRGRGRPARGIQCGMRRTALALLAMLTLPARPGARGTELYVSTEDERRDRRRRRRARRGGRAHPGRQAPARGQAVARRQAAVRRAFGLAAGGARRRRIQAAAARPRRRRRRRRRSRHRKLVRTYASGQDPESFDLSRDGKTLYVSNEDDVRAERARPGHRQGVAQDRRRRRARGRHAAPRRQGRLRDLRAGQPGGRHRHEEAVRSSRAFRPGHARARSRSRATARPASSPARTAAASRCSTPSRTPPSGTIKIEPVAKTPLGPRPMGAALSPDGKQLYVSNGRGESIAVIDVASRKLARLIDGVGARPWGIARRRRRQARLHRQRPVERRLRRRRGHRQGGEAHQGRRLCPGGIAVEVARALRQRPRAEVGVAADDDLVVERDRRGPALHVRARAGAVVDLRAGVAVQAP